MKKEVKTKFGKKVFLLGIKDSEKYYLISPSWDCGWYWGCGYVQTYSKHDINMHTHFDSLFFKTGKNGHDAFKEYFDEITISDKELWTLTELMKTIYTLKETTEVLGRGGSHYTSNPCKDIIINAEEVERINKIVLPSLFEQIELLLSKKEAEV